jgi:hypothetical protein
MTDRFRRWGIAAGYRARPADFDSVKTSETRSMDERPQFTNSPLLNVAHFRQSAYVRCKRQIPCNPPSLRRDNQRLLAPKRAHRFSCPSSLQLNLALELSLVLKIVIARLSTHELAAFPVLENPGHVLARHPGHGGEIALLDLLTDNDPARSTSCPKCSASSSIVRATRPLSERKVPAHQRIGLAQAFSEKTDQRSIEFGMSFCETLERGAAKEPHRGIAHRHHRSRPWQPVNHRKLADDGALAEEGKAALAASVRNVTLRRPLSMR